MLPCRGDQVDGDPAGALADFGGRDADAEFLWVPVVGRRYQ